MCVCIPHLLYPFTYQCALRLFPCLSYCECCCNEQSVHISIQISVFVFFGKMCRGGIAGAIFNFLRSFHSGFHIGRTNLEPYQQHEGFLFSPSPRFVNCCRFDSGHSDGCEAMPFTNKRFMSVWHVQAWEGLLPSLEVLNQQRITTLQERKEFQCWVEFMTLSLPDGLLQHTEVKWGPLRTQQDKTYVSGFQGFFCPRSHGSLVLLKIKYLERVLIADKNFNISRI